ncbi:LOW QUALITY PROTEIN: hypothetical protein CVT26_015731 [Gymnopilus dilepis]|uniref:Uncharacterized protein n=1 Tax=Gymnopilus dilepis TaxID=231916 RepID=A0A409WM82_9AGAR|nr:LOW QUALITY PROTEIN: hypothetical protein CVT26_015731 [Gymnopilus dilepis]
MIRHARRLRRGVLGALEYNYDTALRTHAGTACDGGVELVIRLHWGEDSNVEGVWASDTTRTGGAGKDREGEERVETEVYIVPHLEIFLVVATVCIAIGKG